MAFQYEDRPARSGRLVPAAPAPTDTEADANVRKRGSAPPPRVSRGFYGQTADGCRVVMKSADRPEVVHPELTKKAGAPLVHFWYDLPDVPFADPAPPTAGEREWAARLAKAATMDPTPRSSPGWDESPMVPSDAGRNDHRTGGVSTLAPDVLSAAMTHLVASGWLPPSNPTNPHLRLSDRIDDFLRYISHKATERTQVNAFKYTLDLFKQLVGDLHLIDIGPSHTDLFLEALRIWPVNASKHPEYRELLAPAVVRKARKAKPTPIPLHVYSQQGYVYRLRTFFKWLEPRREIVPDLLKGVRLVTLRTAPRRGRSPFDDDELQRIFSFREVTHARAPHRFWMPMLALYTGMRLREIAQLYVADLMQVGGRWYFQVSNGREGQEIKTPQSERTVPLHPRIIEAGFLDYIADLRRRKFKVLFPELWLYPTEQFFGPSSAVSSWFNGMLRKRMGIVDQSRTFHSLRHNFATFAANTSGVQAHTVSELLGHLAGADTMHKIYRALSNPQRHLKVIDAIEFPTLTHAIYEPGYFDPVFQVVRARLDRQGRSNAASAI
ncbi:MAG: site-specific integrase [Luteibacter sp.]|uniref:site-specific integrase n=1 Tax=Luteibacter sp. TaxID=1886636 RepID=UPI0028076CEF|nr:site-specific integrase [Luteibacter sp.]MDQ7995261.1 site-specific integrase [Luteibacter sp.]